MTCFKKALVLGYSRKSIGALLALVGLWAAFPAVSAASERTFVATPGEILSAVDQFNGRLVVGSAALPKRVRISRGGTRFDRVKCPSLTADPGRLLSHITVLDSAERAAEMVNMRKPRMVVSTMLALLGADAWQLPAVQFSSTVPGWTAQALTVGPVLPVFQASGASEALSTATAAAPGHFRFVLDMDGGQAGVDGAFSLVMAVTSQRLNARGRKPKLTQCFFLMDLIPADMEELGRRLAQASLPAKARERLQGLFDQVEARLGAGKTDGAKDSLATFAEEAGKRMKGEIDPETAASLIDQALRVIESL